VVGDKELHHCEGEGEEDGHHGRMRKTHQDPLDGGGVAAAAGEGGVGCSLMLY
jgi:hypothetical protein